MTDRITKALNRLSEKELKRIKETLRLISLGRLEGMDIKKLKGREGVYRVRKGDIRIIFLKSDFETHVLAVERRSDTTY